MVTSKEQFTEIRESEAQSEEFNLNAESISHKNEALQIVSITPKTKQQIKDQAGAFMELVNSGEMKALDLKLLIKAMADFIKEFEQTDLTRMSRDEAETYGKKFDYKGAKIEQCEAGTTYDYEICQDLVFNRMKEELESRKKWLQSLKHPSPSVDPQTGESFTVNPPIKKSTSTVKISLP